jgi:sulfur carrier protein ThiS
MIACGLNGSLNHRSDNLSKNFIILTMSVTFQPKGLLKSFCREYLNGEEIIELNIKEGQTIEAVCLEIGLPLNMISLFVVNEKPKPKDYLLKNGDKVKCVAIIGGG